MVPTDIQARAHNCWGCVDLDGETGTEEILVNELGDCLIHCTGLLIAQSPLFARLIFFLKLPHFLHDGRVTKNMELSLVVTKSKMFLSSWAWELPFTDCTSRSESLLKNVTGVSPQKQNLLLAECGDPTCGSKSRMHGKPMATSVLCSGRIWGPQNCVERR